MRKKVWLLTGGQIKPVSVITGISDGNFIEILEGDTKEGDEIVVESTVKDNKSTQTGAGHIPRGFIR